MGFVQNPNLPEEDVGLVLIDARIAGAAEERLNSGGVRTIRVKPHRNLSTAVSGHPDMMLHHLGGKALLYAPGTDRRLLDALISHGFELIPGESELTPSYPFDIPYNIARVGRYYFHNRKYTDPVLGKLLCRLGIEPIHVEQGYSKCSVLPIDNHSIVTSDAGIARAAEKKGLDVLLVDFERKIRLPGLNYGFIGGAAGMLGGSLCALNGKTKELDCHSAFSSFLSGKKIKILELSDGPVTDIGSILPLMTR